MRWILLSVIAVVFVGFVLPSVLTTREKPVTTTRDRVPQAGGIEAAAHRHQILSRRRTAFMVLGGLALITLVAAIITGSFALLMVNVAVDLALAGYIAVLLQVKQKQAIARPSPDSRTHG
ncbi:hypothetical protein HQ535_13690 [bacterium]|nr:hypothetical protein [bacterium]